MTKKIKRWEAYDMVGFHPVSFKENEEGDIVAYEDHIKELENFKKTQIPRCLHCKKDWIKIEKQSGPGWSQWKSDCKCINKDIRMCIG